MSQPSLPEGQLLPAISAWRARKSLGPIAILAMQSARPLSFLAAQFLWLAQPTLSLVWKPQDLARWARLLEEPGSIDTLIEQLEHET